jgi:DNA-binding response OmpR family regulator
MLQFGDAGARAPGGWSRHVQQTENGTPIRGNVLVVDDDRELLDLMAFLIGQTGLTPILASDPTTAMNAAASQDPLLAIVDLNLEPYDGLELVRNLRRSSPRLPILVLTGRASEDTKVRAFDLGADDYVVKPFGHRELVARIRAHARRGSFDRGATPEHATLEVGTLKLDLRERLLEIEGSEEIRLTGMEFRLLEHLMRNSNSVVETSELAKQVWGHDDAAARDVVRVTVHRLRRKLGDDGGRQNLIETVPRIGLRLHAIPRRRETEHKL